MTKRIPVTYRTFGLPEADPNVEPGFGGEWWIFSGMGTGLDGTIYTGLCDHRFVFAGALLIAYYPAADAMRTLADMNDVCGQSGRRDLCGQTKMHTRIMPDSDGRMYLGMHSCERDYAPPDLMVTLTGGYPGGHWVRYDPATDVTESLGIAVPGESLMGFTIDPRTHRLYATTHTKSLLVEYDIAAGRTEIIGTDLGFPTRVVERTDDGMIYTFNSEGFVVRFDPQARELRTLDARLPGWVEGANLLTSFATVVGRDGHTIYGISSPFFMPPKPTDDPVEMSRILYEKMKQAQLHKDRRLYPGYVFAYDTRDGPDGKVRVIGLAQPEADIEHGDLHLHHSIALTLEGDVLYVSPRRERPAHLIMVDVTGRSPEHGALGNEKLHDCGEMCGDDDEGYVETALAATTGLDGTVYFGGPRKSEKYQRDYVRWVLIILPNGCWL